MSIKKILTNDVEYDIKDVEDVEELFKRLQGISAQSDSRADPFKSLGDFLSDSTTGVKAIEKFNDALNNLTYDATAIGRGYGYFRARVDFRDVEIKNILLSSSLNVVGQVVSGMFRLVDGSFSMTDSHYGIFFRVHRQEGWSEWKTVATTI